MLLFVMNVLLGSTCVIAESCCYLPRMCFSCWEAQAAVLLQNCAVICHECVVGKQPCYCRIMLLFVMNVLLGSSCVIAESCCYLIVMNAFQFLGSSRVIAESCCYLS